MVASGPALRSTPSFPTASTPSNWEKLLNEAEWQSILCPHQIVPMSTILSVGSSGLFLAQGKRGRDFRLEAEVC